MRPAPFCVRRARRETGDTFTLELTPADGGGAFAFAPGQFNMLYAFGAGEAPISISGNPARPAVLVHTIRAVGAVTRALGALRAGDTVGVRGPFGAPWPLDQARGRDLVIVAGGIGLAPLRPVVYRLLAERPRYGRIVLLYGTRTPADILYRRELERWRARFDVDVHVTVDRAASGWHGHVGAVTRLIATAAVDATRGAAFVCGPEVMMRFAARDLARRGLAADHLYVSMERNMKCGVGWCGHCQLGPVFVCRDGPVFRYDAMRRIEGVREI